MEMDTSTTWNHSLTLLLQAIEYIRVSKAIFAGRRSELNELC